MVAQQRLYLFFASLIWLKAVHVQRYVRQFLLIALYLPHGGMVQSDSLTVV